MIELINDFKRELKEDWKLRAAVIMFIGVYCLRLYQVFGGA